MVPHDWQHPRDESGRLIPLFGGSFAEAASEWDEEARQWDRGFVRDYATDGWRARGTRDYDDSGSTLEGWYGPRPRETDYMPDWPLAERTHLQMYETCSEGTPISPVMETPEELARWLADNGASAFGASTATYEEWLTTIRRGWSTGAVLEPGRGLLSGVQWMHEQEESR